MKNVKTTVLYLREFATEFESSLHFGKNRYRKSLARVLLSLLGELLLINIINRENAIKKKHTVDQNVRKTKHPMTKRPVDRKKF